MCLTRSSKCLEAEPPARLPTSRTRAKLRGLNLHRPGEISGSIFNGSGGVKLCGAPRYPPGHDLLSALLSTIRGTGRLWAGRGEHFPIAGHSGRARLRPWRKLCYSRYSRDMVDPPEMGGSAWGRPDPCLRSGTSRLPHWPVLYGRVRYLRTTD